MIPKVIHYCWFGRKPLPELAIKCLESWKKYLPDYEIKEWNEDNFDINIIPYTKEAYSAKKYAFVSDYARFWILYHHGGLYFDTDVEIIRPMDDIINQGAFMGCEKKATFNIAPPIAPGLGLGCNAGHDIYKELLEIYSNIHFINSDGSLNLTTIVSYTTNLFIKYGLQNKNEIQQIKNIWIYPKDFFCPIDYETNRCRITQNTRSIHHYAATWHGKKEKLFRIISRLFGKKFASICSNIYKKIIR